MSKIDTDINRARLIALELNELCPALLDRWMEEGYLPNFKRLYEQSAVFTTEADVHDPGQLEPWIQWYSIHSGLPFEDHKVFHLTDGARAPFDDIYKILREAGRTVGCFASMNVAPFAEKGSFFVADPWSEKGDASPSELNIYNRFVSYNVREYSNAANRMTASDYMSFLTFMGSHGLRTKTVSKIIQQLAGEKMGERKQSWERVAILDALQFDVFRSYYKKYKPDFASFFLNSVAHLQHSYWRHMDPEAFSVRPSDKEIATYGNAIRTGYQHMDKLVGDFMVLAKEQNATLMMMTALSQQPFLKYEDRGGQHFYRLHNVDTFLRRLGIETVKVDPTMTHQYLARFSSADVAQAAKERILKLRVEDGRTVFDFAPVEEHPDGLYFGCQISNQLPDDAVIIDDTNNEPIPFSKLLYKIEAIKSGRHHPDGALWIQTGQHQLHNDKPSILDILPTQLGMLGIDTKPEGVRGQSLMPLLYSAA